MKRDISEYSDEEFIALVKELKSQPSYIDKVKLFYETLGRIVPVYDDRRKIKKKNYELNLAAQNDEEHNQKVHFYIDEEAKKYCQEFLGPRIKNLDKVDNKEIAIQKFIAEIKEELKKSVFILKGYDFGVTREDIFSVYLDDDPLLNDKPKYFIEYLRNNSIVTKIEGTEDHPEYADYFQKTILGVGYYYAEQKLKAMLPEKEPIDPEEPPANIDGLLTDRQRIALAHELDLIQFLEEKYDLLTNRKGLAQVLSMLFGIKLQSEQFEKLHDAIKKMKAGDATKSPINERNISLVRRYISLVGINPRRSKGYRK